MSGDKSSEISGKLFSGFVNITPDMIKAGVEEIEEQRFGTPLEEVVENVFVVMWLCREEAS